MPTIMVVFGTRPQVIKSGPLIASLRGIRKFRIVLVHTGQHYDYAMSKRFFEELEIPDPDMNLNVGSGTHGWQTGLMMTKLEKVMERSQPDLVLVPGDTNSALAGALAASKLNLGIAHLEAGARSYDMTMPEEVNRRLIDHCSTILLAPTKNCQRNLEREHVPGKVFLAGDTMLDSIIQEHPRALSSDILDRLGLRDDRYLLLTLHRPGNVDHPSLMEILRAVLHFDSERIVFPIHPRTRDRLRKAKLLRKLANAKSVIVIDPVAYHDMIKLTENAAIVLTDSGGLQKEAFWLGTPCIVLRETTEWTETLSCRSNILVGKDRKALTKTVRTILAERKTYGVLRPSRTRPYGHGKASERIVKILRAHLQV